MHRPLFVLAIAMVLICTGCNLKKSDTETSTGAAEAQVAPTPAQPKKTAPTNTTPSQPPPTANPPQASKPTPKPTPAPPERVAPSGPSQVPAGFAGVQWLHANVSGWAQTASLNARVSGSSMILNYNKANQWPAVNISGTPLNGNAWIFVYQDNRWYAATWEWLRPGQTVKSAHSVAGDHIKRSPLTRFKPQSGQWYGFMVSGLARGSERNVQERSNVSMVRWP